MDYWEKKRHWEELAAERGLSSKCPWCRRFMAIKLPPGMFAACNDCHTGDVVLIADGKPAFKPNPRPDCKPWPEKNTPDYREYNSGRSEE